MTILPRKYRSKHLAISVALALGMALAAGCGNSNAAKKTGDHKGHDDHEGHGHDGDAKKPRGSAAGAKSGRPVHLSAAQQKEFGIQVAVAKPGTLKMKLALTGEVTLNPNHVAHLVPSISGMAKRVLKQLGDPVKKGELMAELASRELARMNADYLAAQAKASLAWTEYLREKKLYAKGVSSQREYQRAKLAMAKASVETQLAKRKLLALGLTAKDLPLVRKGQSVEIAAAYGRLTATGEIAYVSPLLSRSTRTASARVVIANKLGKWQPGLFVTATVATGDVPVPVLVPRTAIQQRDGHPCIYVQQGNAFTCQDVTLGRGTAREVAVIKGVRPGRPYVARGGFVLKAQQSKSSFGDGHAH